MSWQKDSGEGFISGRGFGFVFIGEEPREPNEGKMTSTATRIEANSEGEQDRGDNRGEPGRILRISFFFFVLFFLKRPGDLSILVGINAD